MNSFTDTGDYIYRGSIVSNICRDWAVTIETMTLGRVLARVPVRAADQLQSRININGHIRWKMKFFISDVSKQSILYDHWTSRSRDWSLVKLSCCRCYSLLVPTVAWQQLVTMEKDDWGFQHGHDVSVAMETSDLHTSRQQEQVWWETWMYKCIPQSFSVI